MRRSRPNEPVDGSQGTGGAPRQAGPAARLLALQATAGNRAVTALLRRRVLARQPPGAAEAMPPDLAPFRQSTVARPHPAWHETVRGGRPADPERPTGVLPFTLGGWDGDQIARRLSQLNLAAPRTDEYSCVETSFLVELVHRGPAAVRQAIEGYIGSYRRQMVRGTPARTLRRLVIATSILEDLVRGIDEHTLTYEDLGRLQGNMFRVHGTRANQGTSNAEENAMARAEGFTRTRLNLTGVTRDQAATQAALLQPGEFLSCGIDASSRGTGDDAHAIHIRRAANGQLYLYDPWPRRGSQEIPLAPDLAEMSEYFVGRAGHRTVQRTFDIVARYTPPATP